SLFMDAVPEAVWLDDSCILLGVDPVCGCRLSHCLWHECILPLLSSRKGEAAWAEDPTVFRSRARRRHGAGRRSEQGGPCSSGCVNYHRIDRHYRCDCYSAICGISTAGVRYKGKTRSPGCM